jgi:hypothetical protein
MKLFPVLLLTITLFFTKFADSVINTELETYCNGGINERDLIEDLNTTNFRRLQNPQSELVFYPSLSLCVLTRITPQIYAYAFYSYFLLSVYSRFHNYRIFPLFPDSSRKDYLYHRKLVPVLELLESEVYQCDYVIWVDAGEFSSCFV